MTQTQPSTEWKIQPGKPAMTRDEKTLVTDLVYEPRRAYFPFYSRALHLDWSDNGRLMLGGSTCDSDLIEPTPAILAAHGIDADGKPVADPPGTFSDGGKSWEPDAPAPSTRVDDRWFQAACAALTGVISAGGGNYPNCAFDATRYADALMAEVAKREGR